MSFTGWRGRSTGLAVVSLSITQLIGWGATFYLPAVTGPAMAAELEIPLPVIMAGPTIMLVIMALLSWPLGSLFERKGARPIMTIGSGIAAVGMSVLGLSVGPLSYAAAWILLGVSGACMLTTPAQIALAEVAENRSRQALGLLILAGGLTSTIIWPLTGFLQGQWGWRATTLVFAAMLLLICLPLHWGVLAQRPHQREAQAAPQPAHIDRRRFALLTVSFASIGFVTWGFAITTIILFEAVGLDHATALAAAALIGLAQWGGRLVDVAGGRRFSSFLTGTIGIAMFPLSFALLLTMSSMLGAMIFAALYGVASGIAAVTRATLPLELFPAGAYARASSRMAVPLNLTYAAAPPVFTAIITAAGPYAALWTALMFSLLALSALLALWLFERNSISLVPKT